eukprot:GEMP01010782.1.p1 GENE.GEMP01010782.1~~GEMP01010782.1.p1  ORF type:complete len:948 (+),score=220.71 GEMP01010782.1:125-2968(+)
MDFEAAIQLLFTGQQNAEATQRLKQLEACADGWQFCLAHFLKPDSSQNAQFWCLQKVVESAVRGLADADRRPLRMTILQFLEQSFAGRNLDNSVKNKLALLVAYLVWQDYLQDWPSALQDLGKLCEKNVQLLDLFIRFQMRLREEVFSDESNVDRQKVRTFKDQMKQSKDMELLCDIWYRALKSGNMPSETLRCMEEAVSWMDFGLLCTPPLVGVASKYLIGPDEASCVHSANFLQELLSKKGIDSQRKLQTVDELNFIQMVLQAISLDGTLKMREHRAEVLNHLAEVLLKCYLDLQCDLQDATSAWKKLEVILPAVWQCFSHEDFELVDSIEPFVKLFIKHLRDVQARIDVSEILVRIPALCVQNMRYPAWFNFDDLASGVERNFVFEELRLSLRNIFTQLAKFNMNKVLDFLKHAVRLMCDTPNCSAAEMESVLFILLHMTSQVRVRDAVRDNCTTVGIIRIILESNLATRTRDCAEVRIHLLELYVRFAPILQNRDSGLAHFVRAVVDEMVDAIRSMNKKVAPRAAFLLRQMCKANRAQVATFALPLAQSLGEVLPKGPCQQQGVEVLDRADTCHIYEALGFLAISLENPEPFMKAILDSSVQHFVALANIPDDAFEQNFDYLITFGAHAIEYVASFTNPFKNKECALAGTWGNVVLAILTFARRFQGRSDLVRDNCVFLCRRMVTILQDEFSTALNEFLAVLYHPSVPSNEPLNADAWTKMASLLNLVVLEFRDSKPFLHKQFTEPFPEAVRVWLSLQDPSPETQRERAVLQDSLLRFLLAVVKREERYFATLLSTPVQERTSVVNFLIASLNASNLLNFDLALETLTRATECAVKDSQMIAEFPIRPFLKAVVVGVCGIDLENARSLSVTERASGVLRAMSDTRRLSPGIRDQVLEAVAQVLTMHLPATHVGKLLESIEQGLRQNHISKVVRECVEAKQRTN